MTTTTYPTAPWESPGTDGDAFVICAKDRHGKRRTKAHAYTQEDATRIVACVNACAGAEDPMEAINDARRLLRDFADFTGDKNQTLAWIGSRSGHVLRALGHLLAPQPKDNS